jgi:hypothetical protein
MACGTEESTDFTACGGELVGASETTRVWDFTGVTLGGTSCSTDPATVEGFLNFNRTTGRYSVNVKTNAWRSATGACGLDTTYGGFFRQEGSKVCFAESEADLAAFPCDESGYEASARPRSAGADYCVSGSTLQLSTRTFGGVGGAAVLTLTRAQ